jgi:hypothetical protein
MSNYGTVPDDVLLKLRSICLALPEAYEEQAWVGTRWLVRKRTFAHVLALVAGSSNAHSAAAQVDGDAVIVTFRSSGDELLALRNAGHPFFYGGWGRDALGLVLTPQVDWTEVRELLTESYCVMAPKKLAALVDRPADEPTVDAE